MVEQLDAISMPSVPATTAFVNAELFKPHQFETSSSFSNLIIIIFKHHLQVSISILINYLLLIIIHNKLSSTVPVLILLRFNH